MHAHPPAQSAPDHADAAEREERLRAIFECAVDAIITISEHGIIDSVNPATEKLFGYAADEMVGQNVSMLMPSPHREKHDNYLRKYLQTGVAAIIGIGRDVTALRKDGTLFPMHLAVSVVNLPKQKLFTAILHDLTNRRRLEQLVLEATTREQKRIGQDLHDGIGQQLAGLSFFCKSHQDRLAKKGLPDAADAERMAELISRAHAQVRGLAHGLDPVVAQPQDLALALQELADYVNTTFATPCRFRCDPDVVINNLTVATHVYRIAQEAVTNAIKHGRPWNITMTLDLVAGKNVLTVEDDGEGIPAAASNGTGGIGLQIMKSRAAIIGGTLDIAAGEHRGTVIRCFFPIDHATCPH